MQKEKVPIERVLIITDDIALPFGTLRLRGKGSDGGHNGLKNINAVLGHNKYARLRFGVGADFGPGKQVDYVLGEWSKDEKLDLEIDRLPKCANLIKDFSTNDLGRVMNMYNNK
jgi:PTH1 family peptidyl-tRNA hydrolase